MNRLPGRGWAALLVTRDGTHYGLSSALRGFMADVTDIGMVWFRPAALQPMQITTAIPEPISRKVTISQVSIVCHNTDWWFADHFTEDRFDGAQVTIYHEIEGALGSVVFSGYVLEKSGVNANSQSITFECTDVIGYFLRDKTIGGKATLNRTTFPFLEPPLLVAVFLVAETSDTADDIDSILIQTDSGYSDIIPSPSPWPWGPRRLYSSHFSGETTIKVTGRDRLRNRIYYGETTATLPDSHQITIWVCPEELNESPPDRTYNEFEGAAIPVILGDYDSGPHYVPAYCYDWMQSSDLLCKYVYEDLRDSNGNVMTSRTNGDYDVIIIDTEPLKLVEKYISEDDEMPDIPAKLQSLWDYKDDATSIKKGRYRYLRKDGEDVVSGLLTWHSPGGPGNVFGTFDVNIVKMLLWQLRTMGPGAVFAFNPGRFHILLQARGAVTNDATVLAAFEPDGGRAIGQILRLLIEHGGVPASLINLDDAAELQDLGLPKLRRFITTGESLYDIYASWCEEARLLPRIQSDGKITWRRSSLSAPLPVEFSFDKSRTIADSIHIETKSWGPYFNAASAETEQGYPYQPSDGKILVKERTNDTAIAESASGKVSQTIVFRGLYDEDDMVSYIDEALAIQGMSSDIVSVSCRGLEPGAVADVKDVDAQLSLTAGSTVQASYLAGGRESATMRDVLSTYTYMLVVSATHDLDRGVSTLSLWRFGANAALSQSIMLIMDGTEEFSDALGGGVIPDTWDESWTDAQKAWAANYGSGVGGWISDDDEHISTDDTSVYNTSLME